MTPGVHEANGLAQEPLVLLVLPHPRELVEQSGFSPGTRDRQPEDAEGSGLRTITLQFSSFAASGWAYSSFWHGSPSHPVPPSGVSGEVVCPEEGLVQGVEQHLEVVSFLEILLM